MTSPTPLESHFSRRDFLLGQSALAAALALPSIAQSVVAPGREAFRKLHDGFAERLRHLYAACKVEVDGRRLLRPCNNPTYKGLWPDDFTWPHIGLPELLKGPEMADAIAWAGDAMLDLPTVCDRVEYDGTAVMSPGSAQARPMSEAMPLHLPAAWTRLLSHAHAAGVPIARKKEWAKLIERSFAQVPMSFGLVWSDPQRSIVAFGFQDSIHLTGLVFTTSLVIQRGFERAADLFAGDLPAETIQSWRDKAAAIGTHIGRLFDEKSGGFIGATVSGRAFDVWGNGLAWHLATDVQKKVIENTFKTHRNHIFLKGCTRQIIGPGGWPGTKVPISYQNGGYWGTGTGFVLPMLAEIDPNFALALGGELLSMLDSIKCAEWLDQNGGPGGALEFLATLSMPMIGMRAICEGKHVLDYL